MKKIIILDNIKIEIQKLNKLYDGLNNYNSINDIDKLKVNIKIIIITYIKILEKRKNKYLINKINIQNLQEELKREKETCKQKYIKMIYNRIININKIILRNYEKLVKTKNNKNYNLHLFLDNLLIQNVFNSLFYILKFKKLNK